jgi:hypothetical protein
VGGEYDLSLVCVGRKVEHAIQRLHQCPDAVNVELLQLEIRRRLLPDLHLGAERDFCNDNSSLNVAKALQRLFKRRRARLGLCKVDLLELVD